MGCIPTYTNVGRYPDGISGIPLSICGVYPRLRVATRAGPRLMWMERDAMAVFQAFLYVVAECIPAYVRVPRVKDPGVMI